MVLWAILSALAAALLGAFAIVPDSTALLRGLVELAAVCGVFALVCAAEASN